MVPVCPGPFVFSFESVEVVPQVLGVASLLVAPWAGVVSTLGVLKDGEASSVSLPSYHRRYGRGEVGFVCRPIYIAGV